LVPKTVLRFGPSRAFELLGALQKSLARPMPALAGCEYFSVLPIRFGRWAAKYCLSPVDVIPPSREGDLGKALSQHLEAGPARWDFKVQFFIDEYETPIEDPTTEWASPWVRVGRLTLPQQSLSGARGERLASWVEGLCFDPWHALEVFRPLGALMRARAAAYRTSSVARSARAEPTELPVELVLA
jgi:hypothetical protein